MRIRYRYHSLVFVTLMATGLTLAGCGGEEDETVAASERSAVEAPPPPLTPQPEPEPPPAPEPAEPAPVAADIDRAPIWVEGAEYGLVRGLDEGEYDAYGTSAVLEVQQALADRGLYQGPVDGVFGAATREAIGEFQRQSNIQVTGMPSPSTRRALGLD